MPTPRPECCDDSQHPDHGAELARINRVIGQLEGVKKMIHDRRYCPEILTLLRGSRAAIRAVEANVLETHLGSCVKDALAGGDADAAEKISELKELFKRFEE